MNDLTDMSTSDMHPIELRSAMDLQPKLNEVLYRALRHLADSNDQRKSRPVEKVLFEGVPNGRDPIFNPTEAVRHWSGRYERNGMREYVCPDKAFALCELKSHARITEIIDDIEAAIAEAM